MNVRTLDCFTYEGKSLDLNAVDAALSLANTALGYEVITLREGKTEKGDSKIIVKERAQRTHNVFLRGLAGFVAFTVLLPVTFIAFLLKGCLLKRQGKEISDFSVKALAVAQKNSESSSAEQKNESSKSVNNSSAILDPKKGVKPTPVTPPNIQPSAPLKTPIIPLAADVGTVHTASDLKVSSPAIASKPAAPVLPPQEAVRKFYNALLENETDDEGHKKMIKDLLARKDGAEIGEIFYRDWESNLPAPERGKTPKETIIKTILENPNSKIVRDVALWILHPDSVMFEVD